MLSQSTLKQTLSANMAQLDAIYKTFAYEKPQLEAFIKLLTGFMVYKLGFNVSAPLYAKMQAWNKDAASLVTEIKCSKQIAAIMTWIATNKTGDLVEGKAKYNKFITLLKDFRTNIFAKEKRANKDKLFKTAKINSQSIQMLNAIFGIINSDSKSGLNTLNRNISQLGEPILSGYFAPVLDEATGKTAVKQYLRLLKKITGSDLPYMTRDFVLDEWPDKPDSLKAEWKIVSKTYNDAFKAARTAIIRNSGKPLIDADELKKNLEKMGMLTFSIPTGFDGKYDDKGNMYLADGRQLNSNQTGGKMTMLPEREGVAKIAIGQGIMDKDEKNYQTAERSKQGKEAKFNKVLNIIPNLRQMAQNWRTDLIHGDGEQKLFGALTETIYTTAARMGKADEDSADGISVIKGNQLIQQGKNLKISYIGKKEGKQTHIIKPTGNEILQHLVDYLLELKEKAGSNGYIFSLNGQLFNRGRFGKYLKEEIHPDLYPHLIRSIRGSDMFQRLLAANPIPKNASSADISNHLKEILGVIGEKLGHFRTDKEGKAVTQWSTAKESYVDNSLIKKIFDERDLPFPATFRTKTTRD